MKIQKFKQTSFSLLIFVLLVGSGIVLGICLGAFATDPAPIDKTEVESAFQSKKISSIIGELDKIGLDKKALDDNSIINEVVSLYNDIDNRSLSKSEKVDLKKKIIRVFYESRVPLSTETLKRISLTDHDPDIRRMANNWHTDKRQLPLSMQIDISKYIIVNGKGMTYEEAYPILVKKIESPSTEQKIDGVKLLGRYGRLLRNKPVINELIVLYHATPTVPDKPYEEYSESEKENFALKSRTLLTIAISGTPKVKKLLEEAKSSPNESMRIAADKIETLITTGSMSISAQPQNTQTNRSKTKTLYLILGKAVPKQEALTLIDKIIQSNNGKELRNMIDDIERSPSLIKNTDAYNSLSKLLVRIALNDVPPEWKLSPRDIYFIKKLTFNILVNSGDSRITKTIKEMEDSSDPDIKYFVEHYQRDRANEE